MRTPDRTVSVVLVGLQGAGKSTLARGFFGDTHVRVNLDMLRTRHREAALVEACVATSTPFVVDNTNLGPGERRRYLDAARDRAVLVAVWVDTPLETALARNELRVGKARVPDHVIVRAHRRLQPPRHDEGFRDVWCVRDEGTRWERIGMDVPRDPHSR